MCPQMQTCGGAFVAGLMPSQESADWPGRSCSCRRNLLRRMMWLVERLHTLPKTQGQMVGLRWVS